MSDAKTLLLGALTGLVFGFLLQRGGLTRFHTILGQFLFRDFTMLRVMLTAMVVGGVGIYALRAAGVDVVMHVKATAVLANVLGGVVFGVGMAVLGYCPGTGVAALGDGSRHALSGVLGMLAGAGLYAEAHPWLAEHVLGVGAEGKITLPGVTHTSEWLWLGALALAAVGLFLLARAHERRRPARAAIS
jgi:uncharacterized membrane protein YedE/YeeE